MTEENPPVAGWYPHPLLKGAERYWDGEAWTGSRHLAAGSSIEKTVKASPKEKSPGRFGPPLVLAATGGAGLTTTALLAGTNPLITIGALMGVSALGTWGYVKSKAKRGDKKLVGEMTTWSKLTDAFDHQEELPSESLSEELSTLMQAEKLLLEKARKAKRLPMVTVELDHLNEQILLLVAPTYWGSLVLTPAQWENPQQKKIEVRLALKKAQEQVLEWHKQLNTGDSFAAEVALRQLKLED